MNDAASQCWRGMRVTPCFPDDLHRIDAVRCDAPNARTISMHRLCADEKNGVSGEMRPIRRLLRRRVAIVDQCSLIEG
ncbi:TPA: hypothetical protein QDA74_001521 [Burkholderia territorii]|uniref:hypothetical protein n=1 Tax=Burkholderia territorii TaxID=1503055 RepID=UPI0011C7EF74|nr:hypothetical protein [Burkholderia territorii]TXG13333.1 hypothetical protein FU139_17955 [Burkholderia territorii]HDR8857157.1 hypothetical protein [Burkholderia territorii]HDR8863095.1 hypothetical protein [Burkholderia territorii]HDR8869375.1 hypothetical protein [Burkholderia territorii]HDR8876072.1 hypothetical protein [Burkholderia territorii]